MPDVAVLIKAEGFETTARRLRYAAENLTPPKMMILNGEIIKGLEEYHKKTWAKGVVDVPGTRVRWPDGQTLLNTKVLFESMTNSSAPGAIRKITPWGLEYGTSVYYARWINDGTSKQRPKPFIRFNTPVKVIIRDLVRKHIRKNTGTLFSGMPSYL